MAVGPEPVVVVMFPAFFSVSKNSVVGMSAAVSAFICSLLFIAAVMIVSLAPCSAAISLVLSGVLGVFPDICVLIRHPCSGSVLYVGLAGVGGSGSVHTVSHLCGV